MQTSEPQCRQWMASARATPYRAWPCYEVCAGWKGVTHCSLSSVNFMVPFPRICGKMKKEVSMRFGRAREANKETLSCRHCSLWGSTGAVVGIPGRHLVCQFPRTNSGMFHRNSGRAVDHWHQVHDGKTVAEQVRASPSGGRSSDSGNSKVRHRGDCFLDISLSAEKQGVTVLGALVGHPSSMCSVARSMTSCLRRS